MEYEMCEQGDNLCEQNNDSYNNIITWVERQ